MVYSVIVYPSGRLVSPIGEMRCAIGRSGVVAAANKREGDGASPAGQWPIRCVHYRSDRVSLDQVALPTREILATDGWCDSPSHTSYNRLVKLPFDGSHEVMWRDDNVYDVVIELGHNDDPPIPGMGSAIFMHLKRGDYEPTEGCVAVSLDDMLALLTAFPADTVIDIRLAD